MWSHKCYIEGNNHFPQSAVCVLANTAQYAVCMGTCILVFYWLSIRTSVLFSEKLLSVQVTPSLYYCMGLFHLPWGHCKWLTISYASKHWPLPFEPKQSSEFSTQFTAFHWILQSTHAVANWHSMVAKECAFLCGKAHNHFALFFFYYSSLFVHAVFLLTSSELYLSLAA